MQVRRATEVIDPFELSHEVPSYDKHILTAKRKKFCICIFVLNENGRLLSQLEKMKPYSNVVDLIVADGGSTDGSTEVSLLKEFAVSTLLVKTGLGRLSAQMRMAFDYALAAGYEGVIVMDGNNKDDPAAIPQFVAALENGFDHVQGSRYVQGGHHQNTPLLRHFAVTLIHAPLISLAAGMKYTDTTNGFRAYSKKLLTDRRIHVFRNVFSGYELHYYLAIKASRLGFASTEIATTRVYPKNGRLPTKISFFSGNYNVFKALLKACLNRFDPDIDA